MPKPEYLFAMKCRAMRIGGVEGSQDIEDIRRLAIAIGVKSARDALDLVEAFYPKHHIAPKTQFGLEEIFATLDDAGRDASDGEASGDS